MQGGGQTNFAMLNNFNKVYNTTKTNFNSNLSNNQIEFPNICPEDKKYTIEAKYNCIVDQIVDDNENIINDINDYFKIK
jgi:hypothetical protein